MASDFDQQFRIRSAVPDFDAFLETYHALSAATRADVRHWSDCAYGASPREKLDVFVPREDGTDRPLNLFFHGGYWRAFDKTDYSFVAGPIVESGAVAVVANYGLMPATPMASLIAQCCAAVQWIYHHAQDFGASPDRITLSGHSAGGHIATVLALSDWTTFGLPSDAIKAAVVASGIFDLFPVLDSFVGSETRLTTDDAARFSPLQMAPAQNGRIAPMLLAYGGEETAEFGRQSMAFAVALQQCGAEVEVYEVAERHHMSILLDLSDAGAPLTQRLLACVHKTHAPNPSTEILCLKRD